MLRKIGFFHFGYHHSTPKAALEQALLEAEGSEGALIVLPEAFNIAVSYRSPGERNFDRVILSDLQGLSNRFKTTFVAGLIVMESEGTTPPQSACYLVGRTCSILMGYKVGEDDTEGHNYTRCAGQADLRNPIEHEGVKVGALICMDANPPAALAPRVRPRLQRIVADSDVVCVPAHMGSRNFADSTVGSTLAEPWNTKRLILANSNPDGIASFMTDNDGKILEPTVGGAENRIVTLPFICNKIPRGDGQ